MNKAMHSDADQVLQWHPQFQVFKINQPTMPEHGVILLGESAFYWLPESDFPGLIHIDGKKSNDQIGASIANNMTAITFFYQAGQLQQQQLLIDSNSDIFQHYQSQTPTQVDLLLQRSRLTISALSALPQAPLQELAQFLSDGLVTATKPAPLHILLVDDFLHLGIAQFIEPLPHTLIIKITGEHLWISPLQAKSEVVQPYIEWLKLQKRLEHNQPLRHWVRHNTPGKTLTFPVNINESVQLSAETRHSLLQIGRAHV